MNDFTLGYMERKFADLIWANSPIGSGDLVKLAQKELNWKKSTTYTVLRRLCERGLFENKDSIVTALVTPESFEQGQCRQFVKETCGGSLPRFLTAFSGSERLSEEEIAELQALIDRSRG